MATPYPLVFTPILKDKVWGGRRLSMFGKSLPAGVAIGESWEIADLSSTSVSGGGGGAAHSVIASGAMKGRTIREAVTAWGPALLGRGRAGLASFPLLIKLLDARENLSVQVHPSPAYARAHAGAHLKTECWYIMAAEPGSVIYKGVKPGVTRDAFERHISEGTVAEDMIAVPAVAGECHNLPSGTCHALGAGVLVAEVQTPSDTTFRVFDWGRTGRELHVREALACIDFGPAPAATRLSPGATRGELVRTEFFVVEEARVAAGESSPIAPSCAVVMVLAGGGAVTAGGANGGGRQAAPLGTTLLVPEAIAAGARFEATSATTLLIATMP